MALDDGALARRGAKVGAAAAACWVAFGMESILRPVQDNRRDAAWMIPWVLTIATLWFVHRLQTWSGARWERTAFRVLMFTMALVFCGNIGLVAGVPALTVFTMPWGALGWVVAMLLFGIATWRLGVLPKSVALGIMLLEPGSVLAGVALLPIAPVYDRGAYSGAVEKGLVVALLAWGMAAVGRRMGSRQASGAG